MKALFIVSCIVPFLMLVYPILSFLRYLFFKKPVLKSEDFLVPVSIIIACYNEEKHIREKLNSLLDPSEWIEGSEIIVVSGGSTDGTNRILSEFESNPKVQIIYSSTQLSKINGVNLAVQNAQHEILVFSDCRQKMKKGSVRELVFHFNDPKIGTVASVLHDNPDQHSSFFRTIINGLVLLDSKSGSGYNVYGALYAQRKNIFQPFPQDQLFDDLCVIVSTIAQGTRLVQEPKAIIYDIPFQNYYKKERLERLTRGLLLFITKKWKQVMRMPLGDQFRFLVFKFGKLLLPFTFLIWGIYLLLFLTQSNLYFSLISLVTLGILLLIPKIRKTLFLFLRINLYFFYAIFKFTFLKQRSERWEKLKE